MTTAAVENQTLVAHVVSAPPNAFKRSGEEIKRVATAPRGTFLFFFSSRTVQYAEVVLRALDTLIAFRVLIRIQITVWRHKFE